jgi:hypothetical protein
MQHSATRAVVQVPRKQAQPAVHVGNPHCAQGIDSVPSPDDIPVQRSRRSDSYWPLQAARQRAAQWERAGTYTVDVVSGSKTKTVENIVVTSGECHVNGQVLTVTLDP